ncbi:MAG: DUF1343 domain-containing protein [Acidobacteriota bacterium]
MKGSAKARAGQCVGTAGIRQGAVKGNGWGCRFAWCLLLLLVWGCDEPPRLERFQTGADQVFDEPYISWIRGKKVGLITNQTGVTEGLKPVSELLAESKEVQLTTLFAPEHGLYGQEPAGANVPNQPHVYSLYGNGTGHVLTPEMLKDVEVLIFDVQDVGARFYTYISTMNEAMATAAQMRIPFLVLDRPDPIDGSRVEGPVLEKIFRSFVGTHWIPIRYGMTPGELARLLKAERGLDLVLWVVPLKGWRRASYYESTGRQWIPPSPNMPTVFTAVVYPGTCLIEGTNLSEGRGTTRPFELIGAPWLNADVLAVLLNNDNLPGVRFRAQPFTPSFSKYQGETCQGIQIHVLDRDQFRPIETALYIIREVLNLHPNEFRFQNETFDRLAGNSWIRRMLTESRAVEAVANRWQPELNDFKKRRQQYLLY